MRWALLTAAATALLLFLMVSTLAGGQPRLRLATTTSLYDTGLWDALEPLFEERYDVALDILYAGTGKALEWGRRGDVDVITIHSRAREEQFVAEGYGVERVPFASNYFLIVGPESDPAGIGGMAPEDAFSRLAAQGEANTSVRFVSRGDNSGTHERERTIWTAAGFDYETVRNSVWYVEGGSGMGPTLVMANEMRAYTLSDIGTFLAYHGDLDLASLVDKGEVLLNVYAVIVATTAGREEAAQKMVDFLVSDEIQRLIGSYGGNEYGRRLFTAVAGESVGMVDDD